MTRRPCPRCGRFIKPSSHHGVIPNHNDAGGQHCKASLQLIPSPSAANHNAGASASIMEPMKAGTDMKAPAKIMGSGGPTEGWPAEKLWRRVEHYRAMRDAGDRRITRDGEVILWLADQLTAPDA